MPQAQLTNIAGVDGEGFNSGPVMQDVLNGSTALPFGTLVALATPITTTTTTTFTVNAATTSAALAPLNIGISIGGGVGGNTPAAGTGQCVIHGHVRALVGSTVSPTVVGHRLVIGAATAGSLDDANVTTAAAGLNYGVVLEVVTISSGTQLVNIWFEKT